MNKTLRSFPLIAVLAIMVLALAACPAAEAPPPEPEPAPVEEPTPEPVEEPTPEPEEEEPTPEPIEEPTPEPAVSDLGTAENPIIMSFVPSGDTQEIILGGEKIAELITAETGLVVDANVATSYAAVVEAMGAGNAHIGWLATFSYILANERYGVDVGLATVRFGLPYYTGQIIVGADTGIENLEDLAGATVCFVDPLSTSGYIIPRIEIAAAGVDPETEIETVVSGSHNNVSIAVYNGDCDAGATYVDNRSDIEDQFPDIKERVLVLAESARIPNDTVSFAPDVPVEIKGQIVDALLEIAETEEGAEALQTVYRIEGLQQVDDSFYDEFRARLDAAGIDIEDLAG